jgi:hypothetical protein
MKKLSLIFVLCIICSFTISGQFTLSTRYEFNDTGNWEEAIKTNHSTTDRFINNSYSIHVGYWIKMLKEYRWEMIPELGMGKGSSEVFNNTIIQNFKYDWSRFDLTLNNHIYLLNMESDCNCPTFSKDGNALAKGVFINIAPGIAYNSLKDTNLSEGIENKESSMGVFVKMGFGFDIGIGDLFTISPIFNYTLRPASKWTSLDPGSASPKEVSANVSQREIGLRAIFRFDYVRGRRF